MSNYLGVDPGVANIGVAITTESGELVESCVLDFKGLTEMHLIAAEIADKANSYEVQKAYVERFVAYKGQHSSSSEDILMFIGALTYAMRWDCVTQLYRAIDWKPKLCKHLVKTKGFDNPSSTFDKKYSRAAATCITGQKVKTDHEADAICLSYMWKVENDKV